MLVHPQSVRSGGVRLTLEVVDRVSPLRAIISGAAAPGFCGADRAWNGRPLIAGGKDRDNRLRALSAASIFELLELERSVIPAQARRKGMQVSRMNSVVTYDGQVALRSWKRVTASSGRRLQALSRIVA